MTIHEKLAQMYSVWFNIRPDGSLWLKDHTGMAVTESPVRFEELLKEGVGEITRPLGSQPIDARTAVKALNSIQEFLVKGTRLGIPALAHEECLAGLMAKGSTFFPSGISLGALWNEGLVEKIAKAIGDELYSVGSRQGLAPVLDVSRDARWGRTEESMGEDPYLVGSLAAAYVRGFQGKDGRLLATLKHYVGHSFSEGARNHAPVRMGQDELNDVMLLPFEMAVKLAHAASVMPAYHDIDGIPMHASLTYLREVLREKWGFDGIIVSDYSGIGQLYHDHRVAEDLASAACLAIEAGVDVELPGHECYKSGALAAIERGDLPVSLVDGCVTRVLEQKFRVGLFEHPYADVDAISLRSDEHLELAYEAAVKSMVLLKNEGILPLDQGKKIALIGPLADDPLCFFGGYSFPVHHILSSLDERDEGVRTLKEIFELVPGSLFSYAKGCDILSQRPKDAPVFPGDAHLDGSVQHSYVSHDRSGFPSALAAARSADVVVLALGDLAGLFLAGTVGEGSDASSLVLPGVQQELLEELLGLGKPVVLVLLSGRPYSLDLASERCSAILQAWLPGQKGAQAVVDILYGRQNPSGKLPVSIPKAAGAMPFFYNHTIKSAGTPIQLDFGATYPFGHGLNYTSFSFDDFRLDDTRVAIEGEITGSFILRNSGEREGEEVVQIYVRDLYASRVRPVEELKGFKRVYLAKGESTLVRFAVPVDMLNFTKGNFARVVEAGAFEISIGRSSRDILFTDIVQVTGEERILPEQWNMQSSITLSPCAF